MAQRGSKVRLISTGIIIISIFMFILLGIGISSNNSDISKYEKGVVTSKKAVEEKEQDKNLVREQISILNNHKADLQKQIERHEKLKSYETNPVCFITFDDGPSANTLKILDTLKSYNIQASFFVIGSRLTSDSALTALQRMKDEGHVIGVRSFSSNNEEIYASKDSYLADLNKIREEVQNLTGLKPSIVRMPGGTATASIRMKATDYEAVVKTITEDGLVLCDWNVETKDYSSSMTVDQIVQNAISGAETRLSGKYTYKAVILLLHDTNNTVQALPRIIEEYKKMGFSFEILTTDGYLYRQR